MPIFVQHIETNQSDSLKDFFDVPVSTYDNCYDGYDNHITQKKILYSQDSLQKTRQAVWSSQEIYDQFFAQPGVIRWVADRDAYNALNGITLEKIVTEVA